jgi:cobalt transporter subunit CbtA
MIVIAVTAGALSGLVWFGFQYFTVIPLIETAEKYEAAATQDGTDHDSRMSRNSFTALTTVLTAIGFAAVLVSVVSLTGQRLDVRSGALWGLGAFVCIGIAPALGLPPQPPGTAVADLADRQLWWVGTVLASGLGLFWITLPPRRTIRIAAGLAFLLLPHLIGAPAAVGETVVPASVIRQFEVVSLAATGVFWLTLGVVSGFLCKALKRERPAR